MFFVRPSVRGGRDWKEPRLGIVHEFPAEILNISRRLAWRRCLHCQSRAV